RHLLSSTLFPYTTLFRSCPGTCSGTFTNVSQVTLTATPATGFGFAGWSGACSGTATTCSVAATASVTATFSASLQSINHIIFLRSEEHTSELQSRSDLVC